MTSTATGPPSGDTPSPMGIDKMKTNITGLDEILNGGIPRGAMTLISGGPGTGKTMLTLEFLARGAQAGHSGIMLTFEEREDDLRRYAQGFGWDISALEAQKKVLLISARIHPDTVLSGDFDLRGLLSILRQQAEAIQAERVVIDAPDVVLRLMDNISKERTELYALHEWLRDAGLTTIMTVKGASNGVFSSHYEFLDYMANCVICLDQRVTEQITTRRLRIVKYRGSTYGRNEYPFGFSDKGIWIIPVTQTSLQHQALGESMSSGIPDLDDILQGGYRRASCTLITGSSGTGKTTFACSFVLSTVSHGDRMLYLDFEESWDALVSCMRSPGLDMEAAHATGLLRFVSKMPESQGIEEHLIEAFRIIEEFQPNHLVVDAISACRRMGSSHSAFDYLLRLINHCKQRGITTFLTNLTTADADREITGIDLSSVIDTVILLRNVEVDGAYKRELGVLKSRGRHHSSHIHSFRITGRGIEIAEKEDMDEA